MATIHLRRGHVQPVWAGHPWIFAQAIVRVEGAPAAGDAVEVCDPHGRFLGRGFWSPKSAIPVRILTRREDQPLDDAWLGRRIEQAANRRRELLGLPASDTTGYRLIHAEGDGLGGLVVDRCGDVAAVQLLTVGMKRREEEVFAHVARVTGARSILEVSSARAQRLEGFRAEDRITRGPDVEALRFRERGFDFEVPLEVAQKTGFYFDQRENRAHVERLANGRRVLDAFCYLGAFGLAAARGGAERVLGIDSAAPVVAAAAHTARRNGFSDQVSVMRGDLKRALPDLVHRGERFDLVIVDPPKLVPTARHLDAGRRAYRRLNAHALRAVDDRGGLLVSCSCSAAVTADELLRTVGLAARDAGRQVTLLWQGHQGPDHPVPAAFAEGRYLTCLVLDVSRSS